MNGYKQRGIKTCSRAAKNGNVLEHVAIAERALGKPLPRKCHVHHFDGDKRNNTHSNLVICQDAAYHRLLHVRARIKRAGGNPNTDRVCGSCKAVKPLSEFNRSIANRATGRMSKCRECQSRDFRLWAPKRRSRSNPTRRGDTMTLKLTRDEVHMLLSALTSLERYDATSADAMKPLRPFRDRLERVAENLYRDEWVGVIRRPSTTPEPYPAVTEGPGAGR